MAEVFETDEHAFRACILYEVINKKPLKEAYEKMKTVKPDIDYSEFEYWYFRFSNGRYDLKHDRSTDPSLADMPILVVENIVKNLCLMDKLSTRKVCKSLRTVIDYQISNLGSVYLLIEEKSCEIGLGRGLTIEYFLRKNGTCLLKTPQKQISLKGDYLLMAMRDFASVIAHPKWSFEQVAITPKSDPETERKSILFLNSLLSNHEVRVKSLIISGRTFEPMATLLPHFKAELLRIWLDSPLDDTRENLLEVIGQTEQWKNATNIFIGDRVSNKFPIEVLFRARGRVDIDCKLTECRLIKIRDILFNIPIFTHFYFCDRKYDNREDLSVLTDRVMGSNSAYDPRTKIYRIENSKDYIQISLPIEERRGGVQVLRIQRIHS